MKRNFRNLALFSLLFLLLLFGLLGCSEEEGAVIDDNDVEEEIEQVGDIKILKVGMNDALTGAAAVYGLPQYEAVQLAIKQINEAGGINVDGDIYHLELIAYDSKGDMTESLSVAQRLINQDGVNVILGWATSGMTSAVAPQIAAAESDVLILVGTAGERGITAKGHPNIFRTRPPADFTGGAAGDFVASRGIEKLAILGQLKDSFYQQYVDAFVEYYEDAGGVVVTTEIFSMGDRDMYSQLTSIQAMDIDGLFVPGYVEQAAFVYRQARELGIDVPIFGFTGGNEDQFLAVASEEDMDGIFDLRPSELTVEVLGPSAVKFVEDYTNEYGKEPTPNAPFAYDQVWVLKHALEAAGTVDDIQKIIEAIRELEIPEEAVMGYIPVNGKLFDRSGQAYIENIAMLWVDGRWTVYDLLASDVEGYSEFLYNLDE